MILRKKPSVSSVSSLQLWLPLELGLFKVMAMSPISCDGAGARVNHLAPTLDSLSCVVNSRKLVQSRLVRSVPRPRFVYSSASIATNLGRVSLAVPQCPDLSFYKMLVV